MIRAVLFDFGNVVGFFDHRRATRRFAPSAALSEDEMYAAIYDSDLEHDFESGRLTGDEFIGRAIERIGYRGTRPDFHSAFVDIFTPNPPVIELIPRLKPRYRLVLASNTNVLHSDYYRTTFADTLQMFDALGFSFEAGIRKPAAGFYTYCADLAGVPPAECVFIDDIARNVEGARAIGMNVIQYQSGMELAVALAEVGVELGIR